MELKYNLRLMQFFGFIIPDHKAVSTSRVLISVFSLAPCTLMGTLIITYNFINYKDFGTAILLSFHTLATLKAIFRRAYFWYKKKELENLMKCIETPVRGDSEELNVMESIMYLRSARHIKRFTLLLFCYTSVNFFLMIYVFGSRIVARISQETSPGLPLNMWWPGDQLQFPTFYLLVFWQQFVDFMYLGIANTPEAFMCSLMLAASERAAMLARAAPMALLPGLNGEVTIHFKEWIKYHAHYLRIIAAINSTMGMFILMTYSFSLLNIVLYSFLYMQKSDGNFGLQLRILLNLVGLLIRHYIYATAGQTILDQSVNLRNSVVGVAQVSQGGLEAGSARSALQILVTRLSGGAAPEEVNGLGFFTVCIEMFSTVLSASFSHLLVMLELNKKK